MMYRTEANVWEKSVSEFLSSPDGHRKKANYYYRRFVLSIHSLRIQMFWTFY